MATSPTFIPQPPPMRDNIIDKQEQSGVSRAWFKWFQQLINALTAQVKAITGLTIVTSDQASLAALGPTLNVNQLVFVTGYNHLLQWTGTDYQWAPGESGSGYISGFLDAPGATGWHLCNGANVSRLNGDGTVTAVLLPDYTTSAYVKFGVAAAAGPTASSGTTTSVSAGTPAGTIAVGPDDTSVIVQAGVGTTVAADPHSHAAIFTGAALAGHSHAPGTQELRRTELEAWYRL
jgi:hypothetical protein